MPASVARLLTCPCKTGQNNVDAKHRARIVCDFIVLVRLAIGLILTSGAIPVGIRCAFSGDSSIDRLYIGFIDIDRHGTLQERNREHNASRVTLAHKDSLHSNQGPAANSHLTTRS